MFLMLVDATCVPVVSMWCAESQGRSSGVVQAHGRGGEERENRTEI